MTPSTEVMPFGKYKGQPLEVLRDDPGYCDWLAGQDWFRQRFQPLHTVIINNFREPTETPEHNRLQARFLDDDWARRFLTARTDLRIIRAAVAKQHGDVLKYRRQEIEKLDQGRWYRDESPPSRDSLVAELDEFALADPTRLAWAHLETRFEVRGVDVLVGAFAAIAGRKVDAPRYSVLESDDWGHRQGYVEVDGEEHPYECHGYTGDAVCRHRVECKPALGDDYPAVLRQMKADGSDTLVIGDYVGEGATLAQVRQIFGSIKILTVAEIDGQQISP